MAIKVLVVDDSAFMRQIISQMLTDDPEINVVGMARDGIDALAKIEAHQPDVITLDVEMPNMDGLLCLAEIIKRFPTPVVMVSSVTCEGAVPTIKAMELGAVDFVAKPANLDHGFIEDIKDELISKVKVAATIKLNRLKQVEITSHRVRAITNVNDLEVLVMGSSTGGPRALYYFLPQLPKNFPLGIVLAQHMPKGFTAIFAKRLNELCKVEVVEAQDGDQVMAGRVLIAPAGYQTTLKRNNEGLYVKVSEDPQAIYKPSVDVLFSSTAKSVRDKALGIILTGMGGDGAVGMKQMRDLGARTIAEAEESCVVFGMPRVAIEMEAAEYIENLTDIFDRIIMLLSLRTAAQPE